MNRVIRVLIVDDSLFYRELIAAGLSTDPAITVMAKAADPLEALNIMLYELPDIMVCDVEMPRMNGIDFLRKLMPEYRVPSIIVSTNAHAVFEALSAGAVEFLSKPTMPSPQSLEPFIEELIRLIKVTTHAKVVVPEERAYTQLSSAAPSTRSDIELIAIGASTGGTEAVAQLLRGLPPNGTGIVVVQHIPATFSRIFADRLNQDTAWTVREAKSGDRIQAGTVLIAPGDRHMKVRRASLGLAVHCYDGDKLNGHRPAVDVLFESVALEVGRRAIGVILTGLGYDGAKGLMAMRRRGARTMGQDEATSVVYGMPKAAYELGAVERQVPLHRMANMITSMFN
ncbi:protein-glutamate methylesterase/protein-glutamine glutaminase [Paenibacillus sp. strain BS8-2]